MAYNLSPIYAKIKVNMTKTKMITPKTGKIEVIQNILLFSSFVLE